MEHLLGIDLGSTTLKAVVYDAEGRRISSGSRPTLRVHPDPAHPDWTVWDPEQIWDGAAEASREAIAQLRDPRSIRGVAVTGMGMDGLPLDEKGAWLYPFMSWLDQRSEPQRRWWLEQVGAERQFSITGNQLWAVTPALRILWLREHEPDILARTAKWVLIEDFVNYRLCGRLATDFSMASNTLLLDQRSRSWSEELLRISGIPRELLCDPLPSGTVLGEVTSTAAEATGIPAATPVVLGGHDYLCGALPTGAFRPGTVLDVTGTWEIVLAALERPVLTRSVLDMGVIVESHVARDAYSGMCASVAAEMLEWFRKELGGGEGTPEAGWEPLLDQARRAPPLANGVAFLPHMSGSTSPVVDPTSMGAFVGLRGFASRGDMVRAVFEGLDYQFLDILRGLESGLGIRADRIVAIGGAVQNEFWMQNKADVTGHAIEAPAVEEATSLGAAILAGIGVGVYSDEEEAYRRVHRPGRTFEPDTGLVRRYAEGFETYRKLYPSLREVHAGVFARSTGGA